MNDPRISACLITRDEEALLPACLASLSGWVDEICILDTGSTDATVALAEAAGCRVASEAWQDDFARARNTCLAMAEGDWILVIDADERLDPDAGERLRAAVRAAPAGQLAMLVTRRESHAKTASAVALPRLLRNRPDIRYTRPVHESVMESLFALGAGRLINSGVSLLHVGYEPTLVSRKDKHGRNLRILRKHFAARPDDLYASYKLAVTLPQEADAERGRVLDAAYRQLTQTDNDQARQQPFVPRLLELYARHLTRHGKLTRALAVTERGLSLFPSSGELHHRMADLARRCGDFPRASIALRKAATPRLTSMIAFEQPDALMVRCQLTWLALHEDGATPPVLPTYAGPSSVELTCAELRRHAWEGEWREAQAGAARLVDRYGDRDPLKLLQGELSLLDGDIHSAMFHFASATGDTPEGHRAHTWLALASALLGNGEPLSALVVQDLADAALVALLGPEESPLPLDPSIQTDALMVWATRWQGIISLLSADMQDVAEAVYDPGVVEHQGHATHPSRAS